MTLTILIMLLSLNVTEYETVIDPLEDTCVACKPGALLSEALWILDQE
jgi:hypothetical protein